MVAAPLVAFMVDAQVADTVARRPPNKSFRVVELNYPPGIVFRVYLRLQQESSLISGLGLAVYLAGLSGEAVDEAAD